MTEKQSLLNLKDWLEKQIAETPEIKHGTYHNYLEVVKEELSLLE